jgi:serine/threonine protein kinase
MAGHTGLPGLTRVRVLNDRPGRDVVFLAVREIDDTEVAVRVYRRRVSTERDRVRFEQEATALKALADEPHVIRVDEVGLSPDGHPYLVMEHCPAGSLHDHLTAVGRFTPTQVRGIGVKIADALGAAHRREIYHRRVTPTNILINAAGEPVLSDFAFVSLSTVDGNYVPPAKPALPPYAAPEAYLPELMAAAADIYGLGATLYALLAGWAPRAVDPLAVAVDGDTLVDLPKVPWALMAVIRRAMAHDPAHRYADADQLGADLRTAA